MRMRRESPSQSDLDQMLSGKQAEVRDLVFRHVAGILDQDGFSDEFRRVLIRGHAQAGYLGRRRAGDLAPYDADDTEFGRMVAAEQQEFLAGFVADLAGGRYEGEHGRPQAEPILRRAALYVERMRGSANEAFRLASWEPLTWQLGGADESCEDCLRLAAASPYPSGELRQSPGDGSTRCITRCLCRLLRGDGVTAFA
jgi:hypothetical protein